MKGEVERRYDEDYSHGNDILLLGIGNYLMGDEGVGVQLVKEWKDADNLENVTILDGGTGGFLLVPYLENHPLSIIVDATMDGKPVGSISLLKPHFTTDFPTSLSGHNFGLKDMVDILSLEDKMPEIYLFTITIAEMKPMFIGLSSEVHRAMLLVKEKVLELIASLQLKRQTKEVTI